MTDYSPTVQAAIADPEGARIALLQYGQLLGFPAEAIPPVPVRSGGAEAWVIALGQVKPLWLGLAWERIEDREHQSQTKPTAKVAESQKKETMPVIQWTETSGLEPGIYKVKIVEMTDETGDFGEQIKFQFRVLDADGAETDDKTFGWASAKWGPKAKLFAWAKAILRSKCPAPGQPFDSDTLLNKKCDIEVVAYKKADGGDGTKIANVFPYGTMSAEEAA